MIGLIDLDPLVHIVANVQWSSGNTDDEQKVRNHVKQFVNTIRKAGGCSSYLMSVQADGHQNFRNEILPEYKGHRVKSEGIIRWKNSVLDELESMGALMLHRYESDDALAIWANLYKDVLIVENDKDLIQIPGKHYNPYKRDLEKKFFNVTPEEAHKALWRQVITGDPTDMPNALCGMQGVGPKTAIKYLNEVDPVMYSMKAMHEYTKKYGMSEGLRRMAVTYDMVYMVKDVIKDTESMRIAQEIPVVYLDTTKDLFEAGDTLFS